MSHNPYHPPDVITVGSGSLKLVLPFHLRKREINGTDRIFRAKNAYISVMRLEANGRFLFAEGPGHGERFVVEIQYANDQGNHTVTINNEGKSVAVTMPNELSKKRLPRLSFFKTFKEEVVRDSPVRVRVTRGQNNPQAFDPLKGRWELEVMYYKYTLLWRLVAWARRKIGVSPDVAHAHGHGNESPDGRTGEYVSSRAMPPASH